MKIQLSTLAIGIVALTCLLIDFSLKNWEKQDRVIEWDIHSYYGYLPELFIYDDIKLEKSDYKLADDSYLFWPVLTEDGKKVERMSMGTAILYSPFFFVAHAFASVTDYPEDGFSEPYKIFLLLSSVFYLIIGLGYLQKILIHYNFSDKLIAIVILLIGLGTNLLCYSSQSAPMSHVYSFCLFSIFIYYTIQWYQRQSIKNTIVLGLSFGLISLIRPSNAVIMIFFVLYSVSILTDLKQRIVFFWKRWFLLLVLSFFVVLIWIPQCIYWKTVTGHFIYYSYTDNGFFFGHPVIYDGLFSFRKGWLVYTPMMGFALIGIFFLKNALKKLRVAIVVFMTLNIYIIFSWWCWWYGGTLGQRSFIESYCLLAIPLASFILFLSEKKWFYQIAFYCLALFFIWLNIFQTYQFEFHSLHHDGMTQELYFKQFGKMERVEGFDSMVHWPNYDEAKKGNSCIKGGDNISAQNNTPPNNNVYDKKEVSRKTIQFKATNGKYVCADGALNNIVIANRDIPLGWETFSLILLKKNECALLAHNNKFFSAEEKKQNEITATGDNMGKWETFTMIELDSNYVAFKAANGKYLSVDEKTLRLFARSDTIGKQEKFEVVIK
ncbi:MAG: hypothetical protein HY841_07380 [Bacteroidetes bacterium]|nr:hypothetical protein [Bacteroidota bacterium]